MEVEISIPSVVFTAQQVRNSLIDFIAGAWRGTRSRKPGDASGTSLASVSAYRQTREVGPLRKFQWMGGPL